MLIGPKPPLAEELGCCSRSPHSCRSLRVQNQADGELVVCGTRPSFSFGPSLTQHLFVDTADRLPRCSRCHGDPLFSYGGVSGTLAALSRQPKIQRRGAVLCRLPPFAHCTQSIPTQHGFSDYMCQQAWSPATFVRWNRWIIARFAHLQRARL